MDHLLDSIDCPQALKKLQPQQLKQLCGEIRDFLISSVSKTGGHLASNLGVVELTVALHTVFDVPEDKFIFDVGHQSYVHKILTGRKQEFDTLRQFGGLSGFPKRSESEADTFNTGHSSTSISAALGIARGRDLSGEHYNVIAVFGDGALTGGMMYEAMNDAGHSKTPLILILNDNTMSISKNVGAVSRYLRNLRLKPGYFRSKEVIENTLKRIPAVGESAANAIRQVKRAVRKVILPTTMFDNLGFEYMGPIDGHDIKTLINVFSHAKKLDKPVFIHVLTKKGKGYIHAEANPRKFHGITPFDISSGETASGKETYSDRFGATLLRLAGQNKKVVAITGAMPNGTGLEAFSRKFKDRFFDVGIAEQHGVTLSAGLATTGYIPVIPLYSSFLQRAYDQTLHDVCLQNLHVVFPIDRAGIVGSDGETHQGIYDISYLSHMPNMCILSPANFSEFEQMLDYAVNQHKGPIAIRYPRGNTQASFAAAPFVFGQAVPVRRGNDISIITSGRMVCRAEEIAARVADKIDCEILALPTIKPLDEAAVLATAQKTKRVITLEDNVRIGGIGSLVASVLEEHQVCASFHCFGFPDQPVIQGSIDALDQLYGLDAASIAAYLLGEKNNE